MGNGIRSHRHLLLRMVQHGSNGNDIHKRHNRRIRFRQPLGFSSATNQKRHPMASHHITFWLDRLGVFE